MGAVAEVVSPIIDPIVDVVGQVEEAVVNVVQEVGHAVEQVGQQVGKTVEAIAQDPAKAIPLVVTAVVAPELAPLLWEGASTAEAAMVLNTASSLAQGADPTRVAENLAFSAITSGVTADLPDVSTGSAAADQIIGRAAGAAATGQDFNKALGSAIGSSLVGSAAGATAGEIRDLASADTSTGQSYSDLSRQMTASTGEDPVTASQTFQDAIKNGFSPEEAYAIAQGQVDSTTPQPAYEPTASTTTSDTPEPLVKKEDQPLVTVEPAPSEFDSAEPISGLSTDNFEEIYRKYQNGEITQDEYNAAISSNEAPTALQQYQDSGLKASVDEQESGLPKQDAVFSGVLGSKVDDSGNTVYTFDDGSTLTTSQDGEVVDFTEATDEGVPTEDTGTTTGGKGILSSLRFPLGRAGSIAKTRRVAPRTTSSAAGATPQGGLGGISSQYGTGLTSGLTAPSQEYSLFGEVSPPEGMAQGGAVPHFASGSSTSNPGIIDLSYTAASPFGGTGSQDIMVLKPGLTKANINYALPGYPFGKEWKLEKAGGHIQDDHVPQFYSEGGLNSIKNRYVKGAGDGTSDSIPAMLANGEFVIPADVVSSLGNGDNDSGAKVLDEFLRTIREHKRKADFKKLPPDSKGPKAYLTEAKKKVKK